MVNVQCKLEVYGNNYNLKGYIPFIVLTRYWLYIPCIVHYILVAYFIPSFCFYLWLCWVLAVAAGSSLVAASGGCSLAAVHRLLTAVVAVCGGRAGGHVGSKAQAPWLRRSGRVAPSRHVASSRVRARTHGCCTGGWILHH